MRVIVCRMIAFNLTYVINYLIYYDLFQIAPEQGVPLLDQPSEIKKKAEEESNELVRKANVSQVQNTIKN